MHNRICTVLSPNAAWPSKFRVEAKAKEVKEPKESKKEEKNIKKAIRFVRENPWCTSKEVALSIPGINLTSLRSQLRLAVANGLIQKVTVDGSSQFAAAGVTPIVVDEQANKSIRKLVVEYIAANPEVKDTKQIAADIHHQLESVRAVIYRHKLMPSNSRQIRKRLPKEPLTAASRLRY